VARAGRPEVHGAVVAVTEGGGGASPRKAMKKVGQVGPAKAEQARRWKLDLGGRN
jgi:hypothetical protein